MIAPIRQQEPETVSRRRRLKQAHQVVFSTLLDARPASQSDGPPIARWQAWLFAGWTATVVGLYFTSMLGWW
ncbi:MAG: hypothetical protein GXY83_24910 [Rhodopirellula sp.]|nr:hypothetical protein [Rhodopirellula sp.]